MNQASKVKLPVEEATAAALSHARRCEVVGGLVDRLVRPGADNPLIALFERTAAEAGKAGLTEAEAFLATSALSSGIISEARTAPPLRPIDDAPPFDNVS